MTKRSSSMPKKETAPVSPRHAPASQGKGKGRAAPTPVVKERAPAAAAASTAALHPHPVRIGYFNPDAREVFVAGSFNDWDPRETPLKRDSLGDWSIELSLPQGEHRYRLIVDGEWRDDPSAQRVQANPYGGFDAVIFVQ